MSGRARYLEIKLALHDISITFFDETSARIDLTARVKAGGNGGRPIDEFNEFVCEFKKIEGDWYISSVAAVEALEK